jgi:uncharacterized protein YkwD
MLAYRREPLVLLALVVALLTAAAAEAAQETETAQTALSWHDRLLLEELNRARAAHGLAPLRVDARLQNAARAHSTDMLQRGYFAHGDFGARMSRHGVQAARLAENIGWASGRERARKIVNMWLRSPMHRANVLRAGFRRVGVAGIVGRFQGRHAMMATADFAGR